MVNHVGVKLVSESRVGIGVLSISLMTNYFNSKKRLGNLFYEV